MRPWIKQLGTLLIGLALCFTAQARDNSRYVNLFMGTAGDHGQVSPAAQLPLGLAAVCPDSKVSSHAGYDYDEPEISGISVTRVSGVGGRGCGGNLRILPASGGTAVSIGASRSPSSFVLLTSTKSSSPW